MTLAFPVAVQTFAGLPLDRAVARLLAFGGASFVVAVLTALVYRWYTHEPTPAGLPVLTGLGIVAVYLNTVGLFGDVIGDQARPLFELETVVFNVAALGVAAVAATVGRSVGDRIATDVFAIAGARELDAEVGRIVRTVGRVTAVELPEEIEDMEGYDPAPESVKAEMAGKTLLFPRRLAEAELRDRLITRLKDDYRVGHVDVEFDQRRQVTYLAVGSRVAGIGPTLGPGAAAVAVRADPAHGASSGDVVQVWQTDPEPERLVTGELRAAVDDVATVVVDESEADRLDADTRYRLLTLPAEPQADREFASLLRAAAETMGAVTVGAESDLVGDSVGALDLTIVAIRPADSQIQPLPARSRELAPGDTLYVVARPEVLRRLESRATANSDVAPAASNAEGPPVDGESGT